ncbi:MAG: endolytic transglycosylase MltG [Nitrospinota bacterium]|nr:endolytic transglycosylase MltG [Nitrospinota bacterium]
MTDKRAKSFRQWILSRLVLFFSVMGITGIVFIILLYNYGNSPASSNPVEQVVEIKSGMTLRQVSNYLSERKLLDEPSAFVLYTYFQGKQNRIQAGEYRFSPSMPPWKILESLTNGTAILYTVTIPEGYRITEIAELLESKGLVNKEKFIAETRDNTLLEALDVPPGGSLEGYLYPETYKFSKGEGAKKIVKTLVNTFKKRVQKPELMQQAEAGNLTFHEIVTLASLIEKETGLGTERKLISSVFHNRLVKKMRLQTDPTVIYAMVNFDGNIRKKDLSIDSPYNTYKYFGLPPGPIASPGLDSIRAALEPERSNFLYFVSRQDGSHQFSTNYEDHTRAVQKYQLNHRANG